MRVDPLEGSCSSWVYPTYIPFSQRNDPGRIRDREAARRDETSPPGGIFCVFHVNIRDRAALERIPLDEFH